jgi:hypothetical protein
MRRRGLGTITWGASGEEGGALWSPEKMAWTQRAPQGRRGARRKGEAAAAAGAPGPSHRARAPASRARPSHASEGKGAAAELMVAAESRWATTYCRARLHAVLWALQAPAMVPSSPPPTAACSSADSEGVDRQSPGMYTPHTAGLRACR